MIDTDFEAHARKQGSSDAPEGALLIERALIAEGRCEEALLRLSDVIAADPAWAEPYRYVAHALSLRSHFSEALVAAEQAVALDPSNYFAAKLRVGLLLQTGRHHAAVAAANGLIALDPENPEGHAFLAFAHAFNQSERQALLAAKRSQQVAPHRGVGHQAYCVVHLAFRRWSKAAHHAREALALEGPVASVYHDLGVALYEVGRVEQATDALVEAARMDRRYAPALMRVHTRDMGDGARVLPSTFALAAGIAVVPLVQAPTQFSMLALVAIALCVVVGVASHGVHASRRWAEVLRPALVATVLLDLGLVANQLGVLHGS